MPNTAFKNKKILFSETLQLSFKPKESAIRISWSRDAPYIAEVDGKLIQTPHIVIMTVIDKVKDLFKQENPLISVEHMKNYNTSIASATYHSTLWQTF